MSKYLPKFTNKECNSKNFHLVKDHHICEIYPVSALSVCLLNYIRWIYLSLGGLIAVISSNYATLGFAYL